MASNGFGSWHHLAGRFFGALSPAGPPDDDEAWALSSLLEGEQALWARMSGPDRRHAVGVARDTVQLLQPATPPRDVVAAALLHDVGKVESGLGTFARVGVTLAAMTAGRSRLLAWSRYCAAPPPAFAAGPYRHVPGSRPPRRRPAPGCRQRRTDHYVGERTPSPLRPVDYR